MDETPPGLQTQFGDLREDQTALRTQTEVLERRFDDQDKQLLKISAQVQISSKQTDAQAKEVLIVKQATKRTEDKVDALSEKIEVFSSIEDYVKKTFKLAEFITKRVVPILVGFGVVIAYWDKLTALFDR
jgi:chromosome segregation ATPase